MRRRVVSIRGDLAFRQQRLDKFPEVLRDLPPLRSLGPFHINGANLREIRFTDGGFLHFPCLVDSLDQHSVDRDGARERSLKNILVMLYPLGNSGILDVVRI